MPPQRQQPKLIKLLKIDVFIDLFLNWFSFKKLCYFAALSLIVEGLKISLCDFHENKTYQWRNFPLCSKAEASLKYFIFFVTKNVAFIIFFVAASILV